MDVNRIIKFKRFLKTNHAYAQYVNNWLFQIGAPKSELRFFLESVYYPPSAISMAFDWSDTQQGYEYWNQLHNFFKHGE